MVLTVTFAAAATRALLVPVSGRITQVTAANNGMAVSSDPSVSYLTYTSSAVDGLDRNLICLTTGAFSLQNLDFPVQLGETLYVASKGQGSCIIYLAEDQ